MFYSLTMQCDQKSCGEVGKVFHKGLSSVLGAKQNALRGLRQLSGRSKPFAFEEKNILASPIETSDHSILYFMPEVILDNLLNEKNHISRFYFLQDI